MSNGNKYTYVDGSEWCVEEYHGNTEFYLIRTEVITGRQTPVSILWAIGVHELLWHCAYPTSQHRHNYQHTGCPAHGANVNLEASWTSNFHNCISTQNDGLMSENNEDYTTAIRKKIAEEKSQKHQHFSGKSTTRLIKLQWHIARSIQRHVRSIWPALPDNSKHIPEFHWQSRLWRHAEDADADVWAPASGISFTALSFGLGG